MSSVKGRWTPLEEIDGLLNRKVGKIITQMGTQALEKMGKKRTQLRQEIFESLRRGRIYSFDPNTMASLKQTMGDSVPQSP